MTRILRILFIAVAALLVLVVLVVGGINLPPGRRFVADTLAGILSAPGRTLQIGQLDGALPLHLVPREVTVRDAGGTWMRIDRMNLTWQPQALLHGTLAFGEIAANRIDVLRKPVIPAAKSSSGGGLAFGIDIQKLALARIDVQPAVLGQGASLAVDGKVRLVSPAEGLMTDLVVRRTDGVSGQMMAHLAYVPASGRVTVSVRGDEPGGGLAARALALPGLPPVHLEALAHGTMNDLTGQLSFAAGDAARIDASLTLADTPGGRKFALTASGHGAALAPAAYRAVAEGQFKLQGNGRLDPAGIVHLDRLALVAPALRATASGAVDPKGAATDVSFQAEVPAASAVAALVPMVAHWDGVSANGHVASAKGGDGTGRYAFRLDARADGLALKGPQVAGLVGAHPTIAASGTADLHDSAVAFKALSVDLAAGAFGFAGTVDRLHAAGKLTAERANLALVGKMIGRSLGGTAHLDADVDARLDGSAVVAVVHRLSVAGLSTGIAQADAVLGAAPTLSGMVRTAGKAATLRDVKLSGAHVDLTLAGKIADQLALTATGNLDSLGVLNPKLSGRAGVGVSVSGTLAAPKADLEVTVPQGVAFGRPLDGLMAGVVATDLRTAPSAKISVNGKIAGQAVTLSGSGGRSAAGAWTLAGLNGHVLGIDIDGSGSMSADSRREAAIHLRAPDLSALDPVVGQHLSGRAALDLTLPAGSDAVKVDGTVTRLAAAGADVPKAILTGTITGAFAGKPAFKGKVESMGAVVKGTALGAVKLTVDADAAGADIGVTAAPRGIPLDAAAKVAFAPSLSITVSRLRAGKGGESLALAKPLDVERQRDGTFKLSDLTIRAGSGTVRLDGSVGQRLDLTAKLERIPLALSAIVAPALGAAGSLSGTAHVSGSASAPAGRFSLEASGISTRQIRAAGLEGIRLGASGTLSGGAVKLDAKVSGGAGLAATVAGTVAYAHGGALNLTVKGWLNAALANPMLSGESRVTGNVDIDTHITGTTGAPKIAGNATLAGGTYSDPAVGVKLQAMTARLVGTSDAIVIERFSAKIANGGGVTGHGRISLASGAEFPGEVSLKFDNAAINNGMLTATFGGDLSLSGPLARAPKVAGTIRINQASVEIANQLPGSAKSLNVRHIHAPAAVRAQVARLKARAGSEQGAAFSAALDIKVVAENQIFVRGRGLDAELGGTIHVEGTSREPQVVGAFDMRRGTFNLLGKNLAFNQASKLIFDGTLDPQLDLTASTEANGVTAGVTISGHASAPKIALTSQPSLPQDEIAAHLLFGTSVDKLSAGQAATLALSVAELSGFGGGQGILDKVRRSFGLDQLTVGQDANGNTAVGVSRYVSKNISIGAQQSTKGSTQATVNLDITPHIRASAGAGADGSGNVGINMQWDY